MGHPGRRLLAQQLEWASQSGGNQDVWVTRIGGGGGGGGDGIGIESALVGSFLVPMEAEAST